MPEPHASNRLDFDDHRRFDAAYAAHERFPKRLRLSFDEKDGLVWVKVDGQLLGDPLSDARRVPDSYRFHDAMHVALAVKLGWSPVLRAMLGRKRRSDPDADRCEDGGRACMVEEAICHTIYVHRDEIGGLDGMNQLISLIQRMASGFEVEASDRDVWADAISSGLDAVTVLGSNGGGTLKGDFVRGTLQLDSL